MKKLLALLAFFSTMLFIVSCGEDDDDDDDDNGNGNGGGIEVTVSSNISSDVTWSADSIYILAGRITVLDGATLTIEPGAIIKGQTGTGANATALLIARGGTLMAEGTATAPIIFTCVADEIQPGETVSPNMDPDIRGLWGGLIVLGKATISASNDNDEDISEVQIEGIPTSDANGLYGGNEDEDNSGVLRYISIRHGGSNIGSGNEINGLTLGGVGSGTVVENIEVVANQDDGIEWFGGTVDVSNVVVWNAGDDAIDGDQSWGGTLDNFVVVTPGDKCFELDGPEGSYEASYTISNGTIVGSTGSEEEEDLVAAAGLIDLDANTGVTLSDLAFVGVVEGQLIDRVACPDITGDCPMEGIQLVLPDGAVIADFVDGGDVPAGVTAVTTASVGADASALSWTWAGQAGALTGL